MYNLLLLTNCKQTKNRPFFTVSIIATLWHLLSPIVYVSYKVKISATLAKMFVSGNNRDPKFAHDRWTWCNMCISTKHTRYYNTYLRTKHFGVICERLQQKIAQYLVQIAGVRHIEGVIPKQNNLKKCAMQIITMHC